MIEKRVLDIHTEWQAGTVLQTRPHSLSDLYAETPEFGKLDAPCHGTRHRKTAEQAVWREKRWNLSAVTALLKISGARQPRDLVLRVWNPEQSQALELLRIIGGKNQGAALFIDRLDDIASALPQSMDTEKDNLSALKNNITTDFQQLQDNPDAATLVADDLLHKMSDILSYALLCEQAAWDSENLHAKTRHLTAAHFHRRTFEDRTTWFSPKHCHQHFNNIVRQRIKRTNHRRRKRPVSQRRSAA